MTTGPRSFLGPVCFVLLLSTPLPARAETLQESLLRAKPAAAVVVSEVGAEATVDCEGEQVTGKAQPLRETGTAWFLHPSGWAITNAHVVSSVQEASPAVEAMLRDNAVKATCLTLILARRGLAPGSRPDVEDELARQLTARVVPKAHVEFTRSVAVVLPNGRRLPAKIVKYSAPVAEGPMSGRNLALLKVDAENLPTLPLADSSEVKIGDRLHVIGFPSVVATHELLNASAQLEASVTGGAISGFKQDVAGQPVIQTDAAAAGGDSGGPAVNDRGEVVGVMTFVSRGGGAAGIVQGFNFVIPSATIRDFVKDSGVSVGDPGAFTRAWAAGLAAFFAGDYTAARPYLAEADRLVPELPDVRRITAENDERIKNPPPRPFPWRPVGGTLALLGALGVAGTSADWWRRNRFRVRPRDVARLLDTGEAGPVILDVRDSETYRKSPVRIPRALHVPAERLTAGTITLPVETNRAVVAYCT